MTDVPATPADWPAVIEAQRANFQLAFDMQVTYETELEKALATFGIDVHAPNWHDKLPKPPVVTPPPPPVSRNRILLGATFDPHTPLTRDQTIAKWEVDCGQADVARVFLSSTPTVASVTAALAPHVGKRNVILSAKGRFTAAVLASIDLKGFTCYVTIWHEPENDGGTHTPAWYVAETDFNTTLVKSTGRKDLVPCFIPMGWLENDSNPATTTAAWLPTIVDGVVMFIDPYTGTKELDAWVTITLNDVWRKHCAAKGNAEALWGIAEWGTHRTGKDGADYITRGLQYSAMEHAVAVCYFHSAVNGAWWMDDPMLQVAWRAFNLATS